MADSHPTHPRNELRDVLLRIARHAIELERRDEPLEVLELRRLKPDSPVLKYFARRGAQ